MVVSQSIISLLFYCWGRPSVRPGELYADDRTQLSFLSYNPSFIRVVCGDGRHYSGTLWQGNIASSLICIFVYTCRCYANMPAQRTCGQRIDYSSDMVAWEMVVGLTNIDYQIKIFAEVATLTMLQKKFDRLVSLEMTDQSSPISAMSCTTPRPPMCRGQTARSPRKLRSHRPHSMPSSAEDVEGI